MSYYPIKIMSSKYLFSCKGLIQTFSEGTEIFALPLLRNFRYSVYLQAKLEPSIVPVSFIKTTNSF